MFGYQEFMERLITDRSLMEFFLDRLLETYLVDLEKYLSVLGDDIDIIQIGDDYGTQENTAIRHEFSDLSSNLDSKSCATSFTGRNPIFHLSSLLRVCLYLHTRFHRSRCSDTESGSDQREEYGAGKAKE